MLKIAWSVIKPIVNISDEVYFVRGTSSHTGKAGSMEEAIANDVTNAVPDDETGTSSWWHLPLSVDGVLFDIAHHGTLGLRPWTRPNSVNRLATETIVSYAESGRRPPAVVIRSHRHVYADSYNNYSVRAIQTPAWQIATEYVHRIAPGALADIGGLIFVCDNGTYDANVVRYRPSSRPIHRAGGSK